MARPMTPSEDRRDFRGRESIERHMRDEEGRPPMQEGQIIRIDKAVAYCPVCGDDDCVQKLTRVRQPGKREVDAYCPLHGQITNRTFVVKNGKLR